METRRIILAAAIAAVGAALIVRGVMGLLGFW